MAEELQCRDHSGDASFAMILVKQGQAAYGLKAVSLQILCKVLQVDRV